MTETNWRELVVAYIRNEALPVDKFGHQPRLYALAVREGQPAKAPPYLRLFG